MREANQERERGRREGEREMGRREGYREIRKGKRGDGNKGTVA